MRGKRIAIAGAGLALLVLAYFGPSTYRKSQMDAEVERLCAIDGGVKVYLRTELPKSMFDSRGQPYVPVLQSLAKVETPFAILNRSRILEPGAANRRWKPALLKHHLLIVRKSDEFVLAEAVGYGRIGGDPIGPWEPSSYQGSCLPKGVGLEKRVFENWTDTR